MKITNNFNLPQPLLTAMAGFERQYLEKRPFNRMSVTELSMPILMKKLRDFHFDELQEDASDGIWRLLGSAIHRVLEHSANSSALVEERLNTDIEEFKITGQADHYEDGILSDYKVTSAYAVGDAKSEWVEQLNCLALLYERAGFLVEQIQVIAILRDWSRARTVDSDYPQIPVAVIQVERWSIEKTEDFIKNRVSLHRQATVLKTEEVQVCSETERWKKQDKFAVMKVGNKRATSVFDLQEPAIVEMQRLQSKYPKEKYIIDFRKGEDTRCMSYCSVSQFCPYWKSKMNELIAKEIDKPEMVAEIG